MAVIQISKIQVRRGLQEELPQLSSGEFGYSTDERRLWIGNGVLGSPDYAPEIGNTEILTIFSPAGAAIANIAVIEDQIDVLEGNIANLSAAIGAPISVNLADNNAVASSANITLSTPTSIINYRISRATANALATAYRVGTITTTNLNGTVSYQDEYTETASTGIVLRIVPATSGNVANVHYTSTSTTYPAQLTYYSPRTFS
jgi:hypothetical protein